LPEGIFHEAMQDLFDFEFARGLKVGAAAARLREHATVAVGKKAHCLCAASIDAQYVHCVCAKYGTFTQVRWRTAMVDSAARSGPRAYSFESRQQS
jgi:hypothetical protein